MTATQRAIQEWREAKRRFDAATENLMRHLLDGEVVPGRAYPSVSAIKDIVASYFQVPEVKLMGRARPDSIATPRQVAFFLCRKHTQYSFAQIASQFNRTHHAAIWATKAVQTRLEHDKAFAASVGRVDNLVAMALARKAHGRVSTE